MYKKTTVSSVSKDGFTVSIIKEVDDEYTLYSLIQSDDFDGDKEKIFVTYSEARDAMQTLLDNSQNAC